MKHAIARLLFLLGAIFVFVTARLRNAFPGLESYCSKGLALNIQEPCDWKVTKQREYDNINIQQPSVRHWCAAEERQHSLFLIQNKHDT